MRLCRKCRAPIETRVVACPQCGATQDDGPRVNTGQEPPPGREVGRQFLTDIFDMIGLSPPVAVVILCLPFLLCALIGYLTAGVGGAVIGASVAITVAVVLVVWKESRR